MDQSIKLLELAVSWPVVALLISLIFKRHIQNWLETATRARVGPIEVERQLRDVAIEGKRAIDFTKEMIHVLADSRRTELEITLSGFGGMFADEHKNQLKQQIQRLEDLVTKASDIGGQDNK